MIRRLVELGLKVKSCGGFPGERATRRTWESSGSIGVRSEVQSSCYVHVRCAISEPEAARAFE